MKRIFFCRVFGMCRILVVRFGCAADIFIAIVYIEMGFVVGLCLCK